MLTLSRKVNEPIYIGNRVTVTMLSVKGNQFRIGISAPKDIGVHREEVYERIRQQ